MSSVFDDPYRDGALKRGRPTEACECEDCDCPLHTYPDDDRCIWCRNGTHSGSGDDADADPVDPSACFECGDDVDSDDAKQASPADHDGDVPLCIDCFDGILSTLMDGETPSFLGGESDGE